jgi:hypothetical protein
MALLVSAVAYAQAWLPKLNVDNIQIDGNTISTTNTNGDLTLDMNGSGSVIFNDLTATTVPYLDADKQLTSSAVTPTELGYSSGVTSALCGINQSCALTNKVLTGNTAVSLISGAGTLVLNTSGTMTVPNGTDTLVGKATTDTLTNKTIDADGSGNSITNIENSDIKAGAAIARDKLASGTADHVLINDGSGVMSSEAALAISRGGTNNGSLAVTAGGVVYADGSKLMNMGAGTTGQVLLSGGAGTPTWGQAPNSGGSFGINLLALYNYNAELGATTYWSESGGGTLAVTSTAANVGNGGYAFSYDASANNDYMANDAVTIQAGIFSQDCLAQFYYQGFDANITAQVYDGTNVLVSQALTAATNYTPVQLNFICPASGTLQLRFLASADAAIGYVDEVHLGSALNITNVSQAQFVGSAYFASTASCTFTRTNTALGSLADTDCPGATVEYNPGPGVIQTTDYDAPKVTVSGLPPGTYQVIFRGVNNIGTGAQLSAVAINDGTDTRGQVAANNSTASSPFSVSGVFTYTTTGDRSFELYASSAANTFNITNTTSNQRLHFTIVRWPNETQKVLTPNVSAWRIDANISGANVTAGTGNATSYVAISDSGLTMTQNTGSDSVGISCSASNDNTVGATTCSAGNEEFGIIFNLPRAGAIEVCSEFAQQIVLGASGVVNSTWQLVNTANGDATPVLEGGSRVQVGFQVASNTATFPVHVCGIFNFTSSGKKTIRLMREQATTATVTTNQVLADGGTNNGQRDVHFTARYADAQVTSPILVNSVVNSRTAVTRIVSARIATSGDAVTLEDGDWINGSCTDADAGESTCTFQSGVFSEEPKCFVTPDSDLSYICTADTTGTTSVWIVCRTSTTSTKTDMSVNLYCIGAK